ncbi:uncharacterized protein BX663DRAFT_152696 [Cokeromyces recurvatus]|uniref:uncharacterized protein n=1 Tax=Cokeromyces recurvatus TaxID=90255 RepID=UPI0022209CDF|nr:uncharacterized protein BX663DRAFT_152696 [Cokeromyces recurvatus]KAI7900662.1 hypothetical protein BX663DRAFT_152696 [Cokeromyces recurvatus]
MMNGSMFQPKRKERNWKRFIVYFIILFFTFQFLKLIYQLLFPNVIQSTVNQDQHVDYKEKTYYNNKQQNILYFYQDNQTYFDFPWYQTKHTRPQYRPNSNLTTTHLTLKERDILQQKAVLQAKKLAYRRFPKEDYETSIKGSTTVNTLEKTIAFRKRLDCWLKRGHWIRDDGKDAVYQLKHLQDPIYSTCDAQFYKTHSKDEKREAIKYRWQPAEECRFEHQLNLEQWCHILQGRHMLLVGDLVHYQFHEILLDAFRDDPTVCFGELNCKDHTICKSPRDTRLRYIRNDVLSTIRKFQNRERGHPLANIIEWPFVTSNILSSYPILILSRSAILGDDDLSFTRRLIQTLKVIRETSPDTLVIYRSTFIGHPFCDDAHGPLQEVLKDEELRKLPYGWSEIKRRNAIAQAVVEAAGGVYLDLAAMIDLRPDGHVGGQDCLRYCIPGPLDATVQILYHVFLELL